FDSSEKIKGIKIPKLIIHSKNDEIIPFSQSIKLIEASPEPKTHLVLIGSHNTCFLDSRALYVSGINEFLKGL
ncbi:MAG: alpha/beta hydrolase, partial [Candidatus Omnitrophica bacterium]|nr:alpha/beta hydrolase [Candidatus Omnitrophota bacterium]